MSSAPCETVARMPRRWRRGELHLALLATASRGSGERLEREIGDILYELDPRLEALRPRGLPDTVLVYSRVEPLVLFRRLYQWPPAYAQRVVPAIVHLEYSAGGVAEGVGVLLDCLEESEVRLHVDVRLSGEARRMVERAVLEALRARGLRIRRRAAWELIVEGVYPEALVAALLPSGCARVEEWWRRNTRVCAPIIP